MYSLQLKKKIILNDLNLLLKADLVNAFSHIFMRKL